MKIKCEECGAKNNAGVRRCRVCANLLDIEAPEVRKGLAMSLGELDAWAAAEAAAEAEGGFRDPADAIEFDLPGVAPLDVAPAGQPPPPPPPSTVTFGLRAINWRGLRPFRGSSTIRLFSITVPTVAFSLASKGALALISMVSVTCPSSSAKSSRALCCTWSCMSLRVAVLNPSFSTLTLYVAGGSEGNA